MTSPKRRSPPPQAYKDVGDGWKVVPKSLLLACCDCSLVHDIAFKVGNRKGKPKLLWKIDRDDEATADLRRHKKRKG